MVHVSDVTKRTPTLATKPHPMKTVYTVYSFLPKSHPLTRKRIWWQDTEFL